MPLRTSRHILRQFATGLALSATALAAHAATAPSEIKIGTLYASSGPFAVASQGQFEGLKFWADAINKDGGVFVKAFNKKIPVKLVAYDDQSSTSTATTLYNQLITQDKVDVLVADFGSVLTSVAVPLVEGTAQKRALVRSLGKLNGMHRSSKVVSGYS